MTRRVQLKKIMIDMLNNDDKVYQNKEYQKGIEKGSFTEFLNEYLDLKYEELKHWDNDI